MKNSSEYNMML